MLLLGQVAGFPRRGGHCSPLTPPTQRWKSARWDGDELAALTSKTFLLITTVGPYGKYGEHAFRACAENGTHYLDVTGEVPFVARMIEKYEDAAKSSGALMFPQFGIESVPPDLMTWTLATLNRRELQANTRDVTVSIHRMK